MNQYLTLTPSFWTIIPYTETEHVTEAASSSTW